MDTFAGCLRQIDVLMEGYQELPLYQDLFEVADPEVGAITAQNAEIEEKSTNLLKRAIAKIRAIFKTIKDMIQTIISWFSVSKDEKTKYKEFCQQCKDDPELANKKVTLHDFRKINEEYNKDLKKYEEEYKSFKDKEVEMRPNLVTDIQNSMDNLKQKAANILKAEGASFTLEAALTYAQACKENAAQVQMLLDWDLVLLDQIEKELGKKETKKFKKKIKMLQSRCPVIRAIAGGRKQQVLGLKDSIAQTLTSVGHVMKAHHRAGNKESAAHDDIQDLNKGAAKAAAAPVKFGAGVGKEVIHKRVYAKRAYKDQMAKERNTIEIARKEAIKENKKRDRKGK